MINICFKQSSSKILGFNIEGHAEYGEEGEDIVCSAVSALSYTIVNGITEVLKISVEHIIKDGFLQLSLRDNNLEEIEKCQVLLETMLLGFKSMEIGYGDYIKVQVEEV
ncbi:ribosomal-processing cysteine protease Prp [Clostridium omnivorum]|uniref:Ribosomal processing cysteine protease Prp n=1 Tax=Clostridium omnivorum TaxID=1604902 RepID=A0ABQ5NAW5_9CLOT|nr:ribosomal-processing cysteine protease Prp [Clostridium sp. E14]GLC32212.1 hypothetical protein bsdE14_36220 [Clostridium sp. E14]